MSAKSKSVSKAVARKAAASTKAVKESSPKKRAKKAAKQKAFDVEIVGAMPNLMPANVEKQVSDVEAQVRSAEGMADKNILNVIAHYSEQASEHTGIALKAAATSLVYAWGCGKLLNAAKQRLGHGAFGNWRREHIEGKYMSERTSMRYMKLAERCNDVRALLQWAPTLKQAYVECGILPAPPERDHDGADEGDAEGDLIRKKKALLYGVSQLQQRMQQCVSVKGHLDADDRRQLKLAKHAIDAFFTQILG